MEPPYKDNDFNINHKINIYKINCRPKTSAGKRSRIKRKWQIMLHFLKIKHQRRFPLVGIKYLYTTAIGETGACPKNPYFGGFSKLARLMLIG
jgi:hypothetical protein